MQVWKDYVKALVNIKFFVKNETSSRLQPDKNVSDLYTNYFPYNGFVIVEMKWKIAQTGVNFMCSNIYR